MMIQRYKFATKALEAMNDANDFCTVSHASPLLFLNNQSTTRLMIDNNTITNISTTAEEEGGVASSSSSSNYSSLKRLRSSSASVSSAFDMKDFSEASRYIEESIAFPEIRFPFDDHVEDGSSASTSIGCFTKPDEYNGDDNDDEDTFASRPRKRRRGLTRCNRSTSLWEMALSSKQRNGSNGSLV